MDNKAEFEGIHPSWRPVLDDAKFETIMSNLPETGLAPPRGQILNAFKHFPLDDLKVVCLGQDPYPTEGEAHGLAFSSPISVPRSLKPIYKCLQNTGLIPTIPTTGDLTGWAKQGVLLLNKALTTEVGKRRVHADQWDSFTDHIIETISELHPGPIYFMLWGNDAKAVSGLIDEKHKIYTQIHPSPMAQRYAKNESEKFVN